MRGAKRVERRVCVRIALMLFLAGLVCFGFTSSAGAIAERGASTGSGPAPIVTLPYRAWGSGAITVLGSGLPTVARAYGLSDAELRGRFASDRRLAIDKHGRLFYGDESPAAADAAASTSSFSAPAMAPLADTFALHSFLGAQRVIYLDFDGHVLSGNVWTAGYNNGADIVAPPFDMDGNPGAFSDAELTRIQQIWQRVAEDYAPFAVDVATEYPGEAAITRSSSSDQVYGMRVLISPISSYIGNYGGVAYVGVFNAVGDYYKPALVFPEKLANGEKYIGEACSHESGHTLGLYHDGTTSGVEYYAGLGSGDTGWAPIMGNGYSRNLTQWSRGEYAGANNIQDDLAVMSQRGVPFRADDHGDMLAAATVLTGSGQHSVGGLIGRTGDVDLFKISSGSGTLSVTAAPAKLGPNLDISLQLLDAAGMVLASSNPFDLLGSSLTTNVAQGTYYLGVSGTAKGDPLSTGYSSYASLGWYTISVAVPATSANAAPVAAAVATLPSGDSPLTVRVDASGSYDPDGSITAYDWEFGDGTTGTGSTAQHTYTSPGTYAARLKVTDNSGGTGSTTVTITVQQASAKVLKVASVTVVAQSVGGGQLQAKATVKITDAAGLPVSGAVVSGSFGGAVVGAASGRTDSKGTVVILSKTYKTKGTVTFTVSGVSKTGYVY